MKALLEMEEMGFKFTLKDGTIHFTHEGERTDPEKVRSHLAYLRHHRGQVVHFLQRRAQVSTPAWVGQSVRLEDLPDFKERWGLRTVGSAWLEGDGCPTVFLVPMGKSAQENPG